MLHSNRLVRSLIKKPCSTDSHWRSWLLLKTMASMSGSLSSRMSARKTSIPSILTACRRK